MYIIDDILKGCRQEDDCLIWLGPTNQQGRPITYRKRRRFVVGPLIYSAFHKKPDYKYTCNTSCGNPLCVSPLHLVPQKVFNFLIDHRPKNSGEAHGNHKLTQKQVETIREWQASSMTITAIANSFRINKSQVSRIVNNKSWKETPYNSILQKEGID